MLKKLCVPAPAQKTDRPFDEWLAPLTTGRADSVTLVDLAVRHKLAGALAMVVEQHGPKDVFHPEIREFLRVNLNANRLRNRILTSEALQLAGRFHEAGITLLATKGMALQYLVYNGDGSRRLSDIDFMIHPDSAGQAAATLRELGFTFGNYDRSIHKIRPLDRPEELLYRMYPDHLPHAVRLRDDPLVPSVTVDFAFSLTWFQAPWQIDMAHALSDPMLVEPTEGFTCAHAHDGHVAALAEPILWLFTVLHLFRESWVERDAAQGGATLAQYRDVIQQWDAMGPESRAAVRKNISESLVRFPVKWVCTHTDRILGTAICEELEFGDPLPDQLLNTALGSGSTVLTWDGTMEQRLRSGRCQQFSSDKTLVLEDLVW